MAGRVERDTGHRIKLIQLGAQTLAQVAAALPVAAEPAPSGVRTGGRLGSGLRRLLGMSPGPA
jgi:hypothetical protein